MRLLFDACVLYPTVLREILLGVAGAGAITPLWSPRILEEWARAAARAGTEVEATARAEIALQRASWPEAEVMDAAEDGLTLPDPNDVHVLAAALAGGAEAIVTLNLRDFPPRVLARHRIFARAPDSVLLELAEAGPIVVDTVARVHRRTEDISGRDQPLRPLLKRAGLPRLGKHLSQHSLS